jgi:spore coat polysaccharide biosynthesis predicted glycosyltransferase SpsG
VSTAITVIADAGPHAGLGHVARCSALTVALRARGLDVHPFALGAIEPSERIGVEWHPVSEPPRLDAGAPLVLDSYVLDPSAGTELARRATTAVMHDQPGSPIDAAALVIASGRQPAEAPPSWLCGPRYACLAPRYWGASASLREPRSLLVTLGSGGDTGQLAGALAAAVPDLHVRVVRGPYATGDVVSDEVEIIEAPPTLFDLLLDADLVVCAGGQTMLEAAALGVPSVVVVVADNQLGQAGLMRDAGAVVVASERDAPGALAELASDAERRAKLSANARRTVDGFGALRVAFAVERMAARGSD